MTSICQQYCLLYRSIIRLLYATGLRISEALALKNKDVDFGKRLLNIRKSKNGEERLAPCRKLGRGVEKNTCITEIKCLYSALMMTTAFSLYLPTEQIAG